MLLWLLLLLNAGSRGYWSQSQVSWRDLRISTLRLRPKHIRPLPASTQSLPFALKTVYWNCTSNSSLLNIARLNRTYQTDLPAASPFQSRGQQIKTFRQGSMELLLLQYQKLQISKVVPEGSSQKTVLNTLECCVHTGLSFEVRSILKSSIVNRFNLVWTWTDQSQSFEANWVVLRHTENRKPLRTCQKQQLHQKWLQFAGLLEQKWALQQISLHPKIILFMPLCGSRKPCTVTNLLKWQHSKPDLPILKVTEKKKEAKARQLGFVSELKEHSWAHYSGKGIIDGWRVHKQLNIYILNTHFTSVILFAFHCRCPFHEIFDHVRGKAGEIRKIDTHRGST